MLTLTLNRNYKTAILEQAETFGESFGGIPILAININGEDFSIPLDTLRGKLNELEMMTQR